MRTYINVNIIISHAAGYKNESLLEVIFVLNVEIKCYLVLLMFMTFKVVLK